MLASATKTTDWGNGLHFDLRSKRKATSNRQPVPAEASDRMKLDDHLRTMIDKIPALAWSCGTDGAMEFLNQRWLDYTGLSMKQAFGWGWKAAIHPNDLSQLMDGWLDVLAAQEPLQKEARLRGFDGEYRWFLFCAVPVRNEFGEVVRWYGSNTNIEDLKRSEAQLQRDELERRRIIDAIPQAVVVLAPDGTGLYGNKAALELTGLNLAEIALGYSSALHPDYLERVRDQVQNGLARRTPFQLEHRTRGRDGRYRWFLVDYRPMRDEQGDIIRWYATGTDIDDRKQAEEQTRNANLALREEIDSPSMFEEIIGASKPLRNVLWQVSRVAPMDSTVLILGETGTGKELIARAIHRRSSRSTRPFISVNCAAIPPSLIASELFGHEKGAFTSAMQRHLGRFELADGGTIFLDEIGELQMDTQIALLRVLQEREFERIGGSHLISVDVRVLAATNRDLKAAVAGGTFREDLFYRLNVFPIQMPTLHERKDDIRSLVEYFVDRHSKQAGKKIKKIDKKTLELFEAYKWPGNIRELQNLVERGVILCDGETFTIDESWLMSESLCRSRPQSLTATRVLRLEEDQQRELIETALAESRGRVGGPSGAAKKLGIPRQTLESKIIGLGINKHLFKLKRLPLSAA
jgi:formate hydrogenlyase transcriptional activator